MHWFSGSIWRLDNRQEKRLVLIIKMAEVLIKSVSVRYGGCTRHHAPLGLGLLAVQYRCSYTRGEIGERESTCLYLQS